MSDPASGSTSSTSSRRRLWPKRLAIGAGVFLILLVGLYFIATSSAFFKGVVLPRVSKSLNAQVTVADASIKPFSQVVLRDLKVQTTGAEPLVFAPEVRARYHLWDIIRGNINVDEVILTSPTIVVVNNADGTSNLDPITKSQNADAADKKRDEPKSDSKPPQIHIGKFALNNATVRQITHHKGGGRDLAELSAVNVTLDNLKNGATGKLALSADIALDNQPPAPATNGSMRARLDGSFDIALGNDLSLSAFKGGSRLNVSNGGGTFAQLSGFGLSFDTDLSVDPKQESATLRSFNLKGSQNDKLFLAGKLSQPMTLNWGGQAGNVGDASLDLTLTNLNLADWKAFAPEIDASGGANATLRITSRQSGQQVGFDLAGKVENLSATVGSNRLDGVSANLAALGQVTDFQQYNVTNYQFALLRRNETIATLDGSAFVDTDKKSMDVRLRLDGALAGLLQLAPQPGMTLTAGRVKLDTKIGQAGSVETLSGQLALNGVTGTYGEQRFTNLTTSASYDLGIEAASRLDVRRLEIALAPTDRVKTNAVNLTGHVDLSKTNAIEGALKLVANTLDVTPYYDLVAGPSKAPDQSGPPSQPEPRKPSPPGGETEPAPVQLPIKLLTLDTQIARCYLREIDMSNVVAKVKIEGSQVTMRPVQFALNGAPVNTEVDLNLGVPGYQYAVLFKADRLPLEPVANSFSPEYRGRAKGDLIADVQIKGAGVTGPNLKKNLTGNLGFSFTNADIQIAGSRLKRFLMPIAAALKAPGLLESPLNQIGIQTGIGEGKLKLDQFALVSPAFAAATKGEIALANDPKSSRIPNLPFNFQLQRSLAERLQLVPKDTPTDAKYVPLPDFIRVAGSLDDPKPDLDLKALAGAALLKYTDKIPGLDDKTSDLIKGVGGILSGQKPVSTNSPGGTNSPSTNKAPGSELLDLFKRKK